MCIGIAAAGCAGQNTAQPASSVEAQGISGAGESAASEETEAGTSENGEQSDTVYCWAAVTLEGGSGKASVDSLCPVYERSGELCALITWSSSHYDYMIVNGEKIFPVNTEGNSQFEIPLGTALAPEDGGDAAGTDSVMGDLTGLPADCEMQVQADTTAMSTPHLIDYSISFRFYETREEAESAGAGTVEQQEEAGAQEMEIREAPEISSLQYLSKDENDYADCFAIYRYEKGYSVLAVDDGRSYLVVPKGAPVPDPADSEEGAGLIVLQQPLDHIYLAASAAMCQFDEIGAVQNVILSGLEKDGWYIESAQEAMEKGILQYGGKYSAPDYERIVASGVNLAVESTMIHHTPKVLEKLEKLGIPVLIDRSSYESEPLGRAEWVKVYGLLTGREDAAEQAFAEQKSYVEDLSGESVSAEEAKSVAIFSINSTRQVVTRGADDYYAKIVRIAGGTLCTPASDSRGTQTVSMEAFYAAAEEADILIYNASIEDAPGSLEQMCAKDNILTQFRAVSEGNVWCMRSSLYQNASRTGAVIRDMNAIVTGAAGDETEFFYRLK